MIIKRRQKEFGLPGSFFAAKTFQPVKGMWQGGNKMKAVGQATKGVGKVLGNTALVGGTALAGTAALASTGFDEPQE